MRNRQTGEPMAPFNSTNPEMVELFRCLLDHGVCTPFHWNQVMTSPPLSITEEHLAEGFAVLDEALKITDGR